MKRLLWIMGLVWLFFSSACAPIWPFSVVPAPAQPSVTPWANDVEVFGIGGRALVDANGNGEIDVTDPPLPGATFTVMDKNGIRSVLTNDQGYAMTGVPNAMYPSDSVTLRMEPPPGGKYKVIGPGEYTWSKVELVQNDLGAAFLFALTSQ